MSVPEVEKRYFSELTEKVQKELHDLAEYMYDPYDCTDLQELAARAYLMGKGKYPKSRNL